MKKAIILFTRVPIPGQTKTRMMPYLTEQQCAILHCCFLKDIMAEIKQTEADVFVCYADKYGSRDTETDGSMDSEVDEVRKKRMQSVRMLKKILGSEPVYIRQKGTGLGERMDQAFSDVFIRGYDTCVLVGSDIPELSKTQFENAFRLLENKDVVLGPTTDGGFYLIGMRKPQSSLFDGQTYSHDQVLNNTLIAAEKAGLKTGLVDILSDVDTPEDLKKLRDRIRRKRCCSKNRLSFSKCFLSRRLLFSKCSISRKRKSMTEFFLDRNVKISVIVPIYNEEKSIRQLQKQLYPYLNECEMILVDGGSTDRTLSMIDPAFCLLHSAKGRAAQMNLGAEKSTGDILFFLHCDSELPENFTAEIRRVMRTHRAGCFGIAFYSQNFFMWTCRVISNFRAAAGKIMFGDQGIFIDRDLFFEVGGFPQIPIMEDYQFSLTLKKRKVRPGMARRRIFTSDRRFPKGTIPKLKLMWKMNRLRKQYREGVSVSKIAQQYQDVR